MDPDAYCTAGLAGALRTLGQRVTDLGNITAATVPQVNLDLSAYGLEETIGWAQSLAAAAQTAMADGILVFLVGLSLGSVAGVGRHAQRRGGLSLCSGSMPIVTSTRPKARTPTIYTARHWPV